MPETLSVEVADHVATVTLERLTMPPPFFRDIEEVFRSLSAEREVRAVIVRESWSRCSPQ